MNGPFQKFVASLGWWGPVICILIIIGITVVPVIPFGMMNVISVLVFGVGLGLCINAIGMVLGSFFNFYLGRRYGEPFVKSFISDDQYDKYLDLLNDRQRYERILIIGFLLPVFPDDIFCMISGMTEISFKRFATITLLCRPISMVVFTLLSTEFIKRFFSLIWSWT